MSRGLNRVMLIGHVGSDPDVRTTASGVRFAKFSLATSRSSGQGKPEVTDWHRLTCWDKLADIVNTYVKKGDRLYIEGRVEYSTDDSNGTTRYFTDIIVRELVMLGGNGGTPRGEQQRATSPFDDEDDAPWA